MPKKKILVADDESDIRYLVRHAFSKEYEIIEAVDGLEAFSKSIEEKPDLIFLDIMMPLQDGYKTCLQLKSDDATKNIPVVMITGADYVLNRKLGEQLGAAEYITKPFKIVDLISAVKKLLDP
jgi:CheY-like chemotaxis protein